MKVKEAMTRGVRLVKPDQTICEAARLMAEIDSGALPVGENDRLVGMLTDRDIAIRAVAEGKAPEYPMSMTAAWKLSVATLRDPRAQWATGLLRAPDCPSPIPQSSNWLGRSVAIRLRSSRDGYSLLRAALRLLAFSRGRPKATAESHGAKGFSCAIVPPLQSESSKVRGRSGKHMLALSSSQFDPTATSAAKYFTGPL